MAWINAVITVVVPLDLPVDAPDAEKDEAVMLAAEDVIEHGIEESHTVTSTWELAGGSR